MEMKLWSELVFFKNSGEFDEVFYLKEVRRRLLWDVHSRPDDDVPAVVCEQAALPVEMFSVWGHIGDVEQGEEALKQATSDVEGALVVGC